MNNTFKKITESFVLLIALMSTAACGSSSNSSGSTGTGGTPTAEVTAGTTLYNSNCAGCHGSVASSSVQGASAATIQNAINSNTGGMGQFDSLTTDDITNISAALDPNAVRALKAEEQEDSIDHESDVDENEVDENESGDGEASEL